MRQFLAVLTFCLGVGFAVQAENADIQATIESQLRAFLADDFEQAFTYADESIQRIFQNPERFGEMVENGFPMVHRPNSYEFQELREIAGNLYQNVLIQDQAGKFHIAEYAMRATPDGWKIRAVQILPAPDVGV
ncbi:MAG: DUF4864 domain-containing protein [Pseudomonadota bacterium]